MGAEFKEDQELHTETRKNETPKMFGDPKSYEHLSEEERKEMTERMKANFFGIRALRHWS